eukprot:9554-Heterococcus_DN1.PRE.6
METSRKLSTTTSLITYRRCSSAAANCMSHKLRRCKRGTVYELLSGTSLLYATIQRSFDRLTVV